MFARHGSAMSMQDESRTSSTPLRNSFHHRPPPRNAVSDGPGWLLPDLQVPELDLNFDRVAPNILNNEPPSLLPTRRASIHTTSNLSDRIAALRPDRGIRNMASSLRRRRSPLRQGEDQAAMLSRLLSVAAAATAASLMGGNQRGLPEARDGTTDGEDGTFDGFLQALQNGRIASALRGEGNNTEDGSDGSLGGTAAPLNFFRMFRFGSSHGSGQSTDGSSGNHAPRGSDGGFGSSGTLDGSEEGSDGRMVPIIIVGIRSITPGNGSTPDDGSMVPSFLDALSNFPAPSPTDNDSIDRIIRQPHTTRFSHRRRASMGGVNMFPANYDSQRHHRSPERHGTWSSTSEASIWPRPPPTTPASPGISALSSGSSTPTTSRLPSTTSENTSIPSRQDSFTRRSPPSNLESTAEDPTSQSRTARHRRLSESDFTRFGSGASRRNGVVEPDSSTHEGSRSWIIYVLGGSYPENHPILTTPSLFTDSPTYEDMMLLSALLGPAKPPVASEDDVASAPGLYKIEDVDEKLIAVAVDGNERIDIASGQRCLVCLCDFEKEEEARRLVKCGHLFHRECIDQWLTTGRNSCPLCRGQGVDEKATEPDAPESSTPTEPRVGSAPLESPVLD
ncbi:hypothetical protein LTR04_001288 [Oleoguttula sp. CCFEE 6159]|nr:hypothetical protein LTR04_001288 [Oleoguttula sp. CCFEE 6159]